MFINSEKIKVFPFAKYSRPANDLGSRLFYECNIARLITQLIDTDGFIISGDIDSNATVIETLKFNIKGYYFEILPETSLLPTDIKAEDSSIYGIIYLTNSPEELDGQDDGTYFTSFVISSSPIDKENTTKYYIKLLEKDADNNWSIPKESYLRYNTSSLNIKKIDGKH